ncbi:MAG: endonuclease III domain-containing protein [Solirubrobacteraceae bacterium]
MAPHGDPLAELVLTVLSQSTNDRNRDVAFLRLREALPSWEQVLEAPVEVVEEAIRPGGISKVKSARIKAILAVIAESTPAGLPANRLERPAPSAARRRDRAAGAGHRLERTPAAAERRRERPAAEARRALDLRWMRDAPVQESRDYLTGLPGVGRKTAACVLLFSFGLRDVPVDTHVSRVGVRLRLLRAGAPFEELHDRMLALTPPGRELELHVNLLRHGRRTCFARAPACDRCALARMCPSRGVAR